MQTIIQIEVIKFIFNYLLTLTLLSSTCFFLNIHIWSQHLHFFQVKRSLDSPSYLLGFDAINYGIHQGLEKDIDVAHEDMNQ